MTPERFRQVETIFHAALRCEPVERDAFVAARCADDDDLRRAVQDLLRHDASGGIEPAQPFRTAVRSVVETAMRPSESGLRPISVGGYRILRPLGEGGFGVVYLAQQDHPRRTVAIKLLRREFAAGDAARRFEYEARILARLRHPGIARIFEAGVADATMTDASGGSVVVKQPFLALEYIEGPNLVEFALGDGTTWPPLSVRDRLTLFARVCDALQHAHQHGVIHRDLKPDNILVAIDDAAPPAGEDGAAFTTDDTTARLAAVRPTLLDFGVARLIDHDPDFTRAHTQQGHLVGTLAYMSPEQVAGDAAIIDTRSDIYAMGVLLYQLLSGTLPYQVHGVSLTEAVRLIREHEPPPIGMLDRTLRAEANAIIQRAMAKDRERRYASMAELAADVRRLLTGQPVAARGDSAWYVLGKTVRRHRVALSVAAGFLLLLTASSVVGWSLFVQARSANARAAVLLRDSYLSEARAIRTGDGVGRRFAAVESLRKAADIRMDADLRTEAIAALTLSDFQTLGQRPAAAISVRGLTTIDRLAIIGDDGVIRIEDATTGREIASLRAGNIPPARWRFSPDGAYLGAGYAAGGSGAVVIWRLGDDEPVLRLASPTSRGDFLLGQDDAGRPWVALIDTSGRVDFRRLPSGETFASASFDGEPGWLALSPDGSLLVGSRSGGRVLHVLRLDTGEMVAAIDSPVILRSPCFSPDGAVLAAGGSDGRIHRWDTTTWQSLPAMDGHRATVAEVILAGDLAVTGGWDGAVRVWNWRTGRQLFAPVVGAALQGFDGRRLVLSTADHVSVLSLVDDSPCTTLTAPGPLGAEATAAFSGDGRFLLVSGRCGLTIWDTADWSRRMLATQPARSVLWLDGDRETSVHHDARGRSPRIAAIVSGELCVWDADMLTTGGSNGRVDAPLESRASPPPAPRILWRGAASAWITHDHAPGRVVILSGRDLLRLNVDTGETTPLIPASPTIAGGERPHLDPAGRWLFIGAWHGPPAAVLDTATGLPLLTIDQTSVRGGFTPDGSRLLIATAGRLLVYDSADWTMPRELARYEPRLPNVAGGAAASPDGPLIAHTVPPHEVVLLGGRPSAVSHQPSAEGTQPRGNPHAAPGAVVPLAALPNPEQYGVPDLRFSPDGSMLIVLTLEETILVWRLNDLRAMLDEHGLGW